jgi:hypothetical protein
MSKSLNRVDNKLILQITMKTLNLSPYNPDTTTIVNGERVGI